MFVPVETKKVDKKKVADNDSSDDSSSEEEVGSLESQHSQVLQDELWPNKNLIGSNAEYESVYQS